MKICCPECQSQFPISAGFYDADGKRFGIALANAEPALGRAIVQYLGLHKPLKTVLRLAKAAKLAEEVVALANAGEVIRGGTARPATCAMWTQAIEQMLDQRAVLRLPLSGHGYLSEVAFGLADRADAANERTKEAAVRVGKHRTAVSEKSDPETPLQNALAFIAQQLGYGAIDAAEAKRQRAEARAKHGGAA